MNHIAGFVTATCDIIQGQGFTLRCEDYTDNGRIIILNTKHIYKFY